MSQNGHEVDADFAKDLFSYFRRAFKENDKKAIVSLFTIDTHFLNSVVNLKDEEGRTLLDYAIESTLPEACETLLKLGANPNLSSNGLSPLGRAYSLLRKKYGDLNRASYSMQTDVLKDIMTVLINYDADLKEIYSNNESYLAWIAASLKLETLPKLKKQKEELLEKVKHFLLLAHRHDLTRANTDLFGHKIALEGLYLGITTFEIIESFQHFMDNTENVKLMKELTEKATRLYRGKRAPEGKDVKDVKDLKDIKETKETREPFSKRNFAYQLSVDLSNMAQVASENLFLQNQSLNEMTIFPIATTIRTVGSHAQSYLFWDNYCLRINCGATIDPNLSKSGITLYRIQRKDKILKEIQHFINSYDKPISDAYLLKELIENLGLKELYYIPMPGQTVGNCAWRSTEALLKAVLFINFFRLFLEQSATIEESLRAANYFSEILYRKFYVEDLKYSWEKAKAIKLDASIPNGLKARIEPDIKKAEQAYEKSLKEFEAFLAENTANAASDASYSLPISKKELEEVTQFYAKQDQKINQETVFKALLECGQEALSYLELFKKRFNLQVGAIYQSTQKDLFVLEFPTEKAAKEFAELMNKHHIFSKVKPPRLFDPSKVLTPELRKNPYKPR